MCCPISVVREPKSQDIRKGVHVSLRELYVDLLLKTMLCTTLRDLLLMTSYCYEDYGSAIRLG